MFVMAEYWEHYGLQFDPFDKDRNINNHYISQQWGYLLDLISHLGFHSNAVLLIVGPTGIGKTTLLQELLHKTSNSTGICHVQGDQSVGVDVLRFLFSKHLNMPHIENHTEQFYQQLSIQLSAMQKNRQKFLFVIDDAHLLPERTLATLLNIMAKQPTDRTPLHAVLFGGPQLETTIADIVAQQESDIVTHTSRIKPFSQETMEQYVLHRLNAAGYCGELPLTEDELEGIYYDSEGVPAQINQVTKEFLASKQCVSITKTQEKIKKVATGGAAYAKKASIRIPILVFTLSLFAVVTAGFIFMNYSMQIPVIAESTELSLPPANKQIITAVTESAGFYKDSQHSANNQSTSLDQSNDINLISLSQPALLKHNKDAPNDTNTVSVANESEITISSTNNEDTADLQFSAEKLQKPTKVVTESVINEPVVTVSPVNNENTTDLQFLTEKPQQPTELVAESVINEPGMTVSLTNKEDTADLQLSTEKLQELTKVETKVEKVSLYTEQENRLLSLNPQHYTIQLMGAYNMQPLTQYIKQVGLEDKIYYFHTLHNGKDWYVALFGDYTTKKMAEHAVSQLPKLAQAQKPWIRSVSGIHKGIKNEK